MAVQISRSLMKKNQGSTIIPKEHIPKVDLEISELKAIKYDIKERLCVQKFPTRNCAAQRPKSVKTKESSSRAGTSTFSRAVSTRASSSSTRVLEPANVREQNADDVARLFKRSLSLCKRQERTSSVEEKESFQDYIKNYANIRIFGSQAKGENVLLERRKKHKESKKQNIKMPLHFTPEVINERSAPHLRSYPGPKADHLFTYTRTKSKPRKLKPLGIISKHEVCLPHLSHERFPRPDPRYLHSNGVGEEDELVFDIPSSTAFWEQYVLSLVSKRTAQWIANRCSAGEKRNHLIQFLDTMYKVDFEEDGAMSARKLLENDDDCITTQKKS